MSDINSSTTSSTKTFVTALVLNGAIAGVEIVVFTLVRRRFRPIYEPRSFSFPESKRQQPLSPQFLGWFISVFNADYRKIKDINGLDCYFFVRFLRMMVRILLPIWLLSWLVLLPLTSIKTGVAGDKGLDKFVFGNIGDTAQPRYAGHLVLTWIFTIWILWNIKHEMAHYVRIRQEYLASPAHSSTAQACTILVTGIPPKYLSELALTRIFGHLPGGVRKVWINRDLGDMPDLYKRRLEACNMLESAETSLLQTAIKRYNKQQKKVMETEDKEKSSPEAVVINRESDTEVARTAPIEELVPREKRPSHRLPLFSWMPFSLPFVGKKVDTIEWARDQVYELNTHLKQKREILASDIAKTTAAEAQTTNRKLNIGAGKLNIAMPALSVTLPLVGTLPVVDFSDQTYPPANGAFILFNKQIAAHMAVQTLTHHEPYRMSASLKCVEVAPDDVIWDNLVLNGYERRVRLAISWAATIGIIIVWAIPVAFIGLISNIRGLCKTYHWLAWVCKAPSVIIGLVQGFAPTVLLAVLFMLVPIVMRKLARFEGITQKRSVELSLMDRFFLFQVVNGFLVVAVASGIIAALPSLVNHPTSVPSILAQNLPKSSTFFLTFILLQGLSGVGGGFLQIVPLVLYYVKITLLGSTPRSVYGIKYESRTSEWGTLFPTTTQLVVITFGFSIISPIINGLAFAAFLLFYFLYKYLFTWVNDESESSDTGGLFFPKAIQHVFVGLYVQQLCLCALFFLAQNGKKSPSALPEGALMVVLIIFTGFFNNLINNSYAPLIKYLPLTLADGPLDDAVGAEQEVPTTTDIPQLGPLSPNDAKDIDQEDDAIASGPSPSSRNETHAPSNLPFAKATEDEPTDFTHPAAVEEQRLVWLPSDHLGLVHEIKRDLDSQGILHSTEGATMDGKGNVDVTPEIPENVLRCLFPQDA